MQQQQQYLKEYQKVDHGFPSLQSSRRSLHTSSYSISKITPNVKISQNPGDRVLVHQVATSQVNTFSRLAHRNHAFSKKQRVVEQMSQQRQHEVVKDNDDDSCDVDLDATNNFEIEDGGGFKNNDYLSGEDDVSDCKNNHDDDDDDDDIDIHVDDNDIDIHVDDDDSDIHVDDDDSEEERKDRIDDSFIALKQIMKQQKLGKQQMQQEPKKSKFKLEQAQNTMRIVSNKSNFKRPYFQGSNILPKSKIDPNIKASIYIQPEVQALPQIPEIQLLKSSLQEKFKCYNCREVFGTNGRIPYSLKCNCKVTYCQQCWIQVIKEQFNDAISCPIDCKKDRGSVFSQKSSICQPAMIPLQLLGKEPTSKEFFRVNYKVFDRQHQLYAESLRQIKQFYLSKKKEQEEEKRNQEIKIIPEMKKIVDQTTLPCGHMMRIQDLQVQFQHKYKPEDYKNIPFINCMIECPECNTGFNYQKFRHNSEQTDKAAIKMHFPSQVSVQQANRVQFSQTKYSVLSETMDLKDQNFKKIDQGIQFSDCVICQKLNHNLNQRYNVFGTEKLNICLQCLCLKCISTSPPIQFNAKNQQFEGVQAVKKVTFSIPKYEHFIKIQVQRIPSYQGEVFSHLHFINFLNKRYQHQNGGIFIDQQIEKYLNNDIQKRNQLQKELDKYDLCAVCEVSRMNVDTKISGYKMNLSMNSFVCKQCVDDKKDQVINQWKDHYDNTVQRFLKFRSKRDGIISYFKGIIVKHEDGKNDNDSDNDDDNNKNFERNEYYEFQSEMMEQPLLHLIQRDGHQEEKDLPECNICLGCYDNSIRLPMIICNEKHTMCLPCLAEHILVFSKKENNHELKCSLCDVVFMNTEHINTKNDIKKNFEIDQSVLNAIDKLNYMRMSRRAIK